MSDDPTIEINEACHWWSKINPNSVLEPQDFQFLKNNCEMMEIWSTDALQQSKFPIVLIIFLSSDKAAQLGCVAGLLADVTLN